MVSSTCRWPPRAARPAACDRAPAQTPGNHSAAWREIRSIIRIIRRRSSSGRLRSIRSVRTRWRSKLPARSRRPLGPPASRAALAPHPAHPLRTQPRGSSLGAHPPGSAGPPPAACVDLTGAIAHAYLRRGCLRFRFRPDGAARELRHRPGGGRQIRHWPRVLLHDPPRRHRGLARRGPRIRIAACRASSRIRPARLRRRTDSSWPFRRSWQRRSDPDPPQPV